MQGAIVFSAISLIALAIFKCAKNRQFKNSESSSENPRTNIHDQVVKKWSVKSGAELQLVREDRDLQWVFLDKGKKHISTAINDVIYYETYVLEVPPKDRVLVLQQAKRIRELIQNRTAKTPDLVEWLRSTPLDRRISYFMECDLKKLKYSDKGTLTVEVQPRTFTSQVGGVSIDRNLWAVTVVCMLDKNEKCPFGHSVIVYEGVSEGKHFTHYAHFVDRWDKPGVGKVIHIKNKVLKTKDIRSQSQTWIKQSFRVNEMIELIEDMVEKQKKEDIFIYSALGSLLNTIVSFEIGKRFGNPTLKLNCHLWIAFALNACGIHVLDNLQLIASIPILHTPLLKLKK